MKHQKNPALTRFVNQLDSGVCFKLLSFYIVHDCKDGKSLQGIPGSRFCKFVVNNSG